MSRRLLDKFIQLSSETPCVLGAAAVEYENIEGRNGGATPYTGPERRMRVMRKITFTVVLNDGTTVEITVTPP